MRGKKVLVIAVCVSAILCMTLAVLYFSIHHIEKSRGTMIINGEIISNGEITFCESKELRYVQLPLLVVLEKVGCDIEWVTAERAYIKNKDAMYILDYHSKTLTEANEENNNLLIPSPGCHYFVCTFSSNDVLVDDVTLKSICSFMKTSISIDINFVQHTVLLSSI